MNEEELRADLLKSLNECLAFGQRPDEYQMRHNILVRQLAAYILRKEFEGLESNDE